MNHYMSHFGSLTLLACLMAVSFESACGQQRDLDRVASPVAAEIRDPHTGLRWLLLRNPAHPGGPGKLVVAEPPRANEGSAPEPILEPVIHAGDAIEIEESTTVAQVRLAAVALGPAERGAGFRARLVLGGSLVKAIALSERRAVFAATAGVEP